jgi:2-polyprenyl-3-methyl-5-hydroxy-6-metoxy-1,4-benzoquinol methylase
VTAEAYWSERFAIPEGLRHHSRQNAQITRSFLYAVRTHKRQDADSLASALYSASSIIEIGCGTGELAAAITDRVNLKMYLATDLSQYALTYARTYHRAVGLQFFPFNILQDWPTLLANFDIALSSNVLEHFRGWKLVLDRMLTLAPRAIILVPYMQRITDDYEAEGGAGHATKFALGSFKDYQVLDWLKFTSPGWSCKGSRYQMAALLSR